MRNDECSLVEATLTAEHEQHVGCSDAERFSHEPIPDAVAIDSVAVGSVFVACAVNFEFCELARAARKRKRRGS